MKRLITGVLILLGITIPLKSIAASLTFSYMERPPYYFTTAQGAADGLLVTRTKKILQTAGIDAQFLSLTPNKINYILRYANTPHCSIGWFKKPERELFAKFTKPIYRNQPLVILTTKEQEKHFKKAHTLEDIFTNRELILARIGSFSYGTYVDQLLEKLSPKSQFYSKKQSSLLQALYTRQASYMLIAPEEIEQMIVTAKLPAEEFIQIPLDDIPHGNLRYFMCGHAISDHLLEQLNAAIVKLYPTLD